jgi:hypothetical protein
MILYQIDIATVGSLEPFAWKEVNRVYQLDELPMAVVHIFQLMPETSALRIRRIGERRD